MPKTRAKAENTAGAAAITANTLGQHQEPSVQDPPRRGRGRPKKTAEVAPDGQMANTVATRKRNRKDVSVDETDEVVTKRTKVDDENENLPPAPPVNKGQRGRKPAAITPRDRLPDRPGRNVNPIPKTPARRTSKEVQAAREAKERELERQIQELMEAKRRIAEVNMAEDAEAVEDHYPTRLSAALRKCQNTEESGEEEGEPFDFREVDAMSTSSDADEHPEPKRRGRAAKGWLRKEIQSMEVNMQEKDGGERKKTKLANINNFPHLESDPKTYQHSGLRKNYKTTREREALDPLSSGGLDDDDALATRPQFPKAKTRLPTYQMIPEPKDLKRDYSRKNNFVEIEADNRDGGARAGARGTRTKTKVATAEPSKLQKPATPDTSTDLIKDRRFAKFLVPTLSHLLYISREPFKHFTLDSPEFLATIQTAFNYSYPNISRVLTASDDITIQAYKRIKTRKSKLASDILNLIKNFLKSHEFVDKPEAIRKYVTSALAPGGPAYYAIPTPRDADDLELETGSKPKPEGFLQTQFIAPIAKQYLNYASNSQMDPPIGRKNPPKGLYALIMTAVERAFVAHIKGTFNEPKQFNHDNCWKPLLDFLRILDKVKEENWSSVLQFSAATVDSDSDSNPDILQADHSMISAFRAGIYVGSSPIKPTLK